MGFMPRAREDDGGSTSAALPPPPYWDDSGNLSANGATLAVHLILSGETLTHSWGSSIANESGTDVYEAATDGSSVQCKTTSVCFGHNGRNHGKVEVFSPRRLAQKFLDDPARLGKAVLPLLESFRLKARILAGIDATSLSKLLAAGGVSSREMTEALTQLCWHGLSSDEEEASVAKALLEAGALVNPYVLGESSGVASIYVGTVSEHTPFMNAAYKGRSTLLALLLEHGADPTLKCKCHHKTALQWAKEAGAQCLAVFHAAMNK